MAYNVSNTAGTVMGIAGMGIGLGLLAHTARGVTDTMYGQRRRYSARKVAKRYSPPRMPTAFRPMQNRPLRWRY